VDITDAERLLEDLVSKSRVVAFISEEFNATSEEGGVSRIDKVDLCPEAR
jgi:hypothetical protein